MNRLLSTAVAAAFGLTAAGCLTAAPLQTASTVDDGVYRVGAQASATAWCGGFTRPPNGCPLIPAGVPLPEVRLGARHGVHPGVDLGLSVRAAPLLEDAESPALLGMNFGFLADGKAELWSRPRPDGGRHLLSAGLGLGYGSQWVDGVDRAIGQVDLVVPLLYGLQRANGGEFFAGPRLLQRWSLEDINGDDEREVLPDTWGAFTVGYATGGKTRFISALEYFAPLSGLSGGLFTVSAGLLWDVGG